ncbi:MAG: MotA/TolQ/ExbB proton channel family protein [Pseudomonadota bacterium]
MAEFGPPDIPPPLSTTETEASRLLGQFVLPPELVSFMDRGGAAIWIIVALSVATIAIILWKCWRLAMAGTWRRSRVEAAVWFWLQNDWSAAITHVEKAHGIRARIVGSAMAALVRLDFDTALAREEATRVAKARIAEAASGLRALELIASGARRLGVLGTVLGMIAAFQALQETGARADPAALAGGIWEALLTTAAGMAVAIPAAVALAWFEGVIARLRQDAEGMVSRVLVHTEHQVKHRTEQARAAE